MNKKYNLNLYELDDGKTYERSDGNKVYIIDGQLLFTDSSMGNVIVRQQDRFKLIEEKPTHVWKAYYAIEDEYPVYVSYYINKADFNTEHRQLRNSDPLHTLLSWERIELESEE